MAVHIRNGKASIKDTRSKKQRRAENNKRRTTWAIKPVTRVKPSGKAYNRQKAKRNTNDNYN